MKISIGIATIPFEGPFHFGIALGGVTWGMISTTLVFVLAEKKGPAFYETSAEKIIDACGHPLIVTALWIFLYYTYVAIQVQTVFSIHAFEMFTKDDVTEKYAPNASRFAGNMFDQGVVFLVGLWVYTLFCDYASAGPLGYWYIFGRLTYPLYYMKFRQFVMWFEFCTQPQYGIIGIFMLGMVVNGLGGGKEWARFGKDNSILAGIAGFLVGSLSIFPYANPLTCLYGFIHYKLDRRVKNNELSKVANVVPVAN